MPASKNGQSPAAAAGDELVDAVERTRDEVRDRARAAVGVSGEESGDVASLRQVLREHHLGTYPLYALGLLSIVDTFFTFGLFVLAPEIARSLGIELSLVAALLALQGLAGAVSPLLIAALAQKPRRAFLALSTGAIWSLCAIGAGFVTGSLELLVVLVVNGLTTGSVAALHQPLLLDTFPPAGRVRALSYYSSANSIGNVIAPLVVAGLTASLGFTWRGVFLAMGLSSLISVAFCVRLRDPGFGRWDTDRIREAVRERTAGPAVETVELRFFEIVRRLFLIPTVRRLLTAFTVFGVLVVPYATFLQFFLSERWNMGPGARGLFTAATAAASALALVVFGRRGEAVFRRDPGRLLSHAGSALALAVGLLALGALSPWFVATIVLMMASGACTALLQPAIGIAVLSVIPARMRPHAAALLGIFAVGVGGFAGLFFLSGVDRRFGIAGSLVSLLLPGVLGALLIRSTGRFVGRDLDRMIDEILEDETIREIQASGGHLPMLSCRGLDFSYGSLQVLFGVDFTVDEGEIVALLGVNGAGKSTLLRAISGVRLPTRGSVRLGGTDITYLDAERRVKLGITQVPGGKAVFGPLTVVENLRAFGYALGRNREALDAAIDLSLATFPRLGERHNQAAATLSGGEQQMLGLSKALILKPRLLCIDELSLGLAPILVGQLLEMVRQINASGTAVVLVEQSVNIALNLVNHAYFMEKGRIQFDGDSSELLGRDDLLRAVFLGKDVALPGDGRGR